MGKKKVAVQSSEQVLKDSAAVEAAVVKSAGKEAAKRFDKGKAFVHASYNNTLVTVSDEKGNVIAWASAGSLGFAGPKKATPFAASKVVAALAEKLRKSGPTNLEVFVTGVGGGRDSAVRSLNNQGFNLIAIHDVTPIPHNGPRPKKVRRI
jgi:small subunit ribosomal protein S11